MKTAYNNMDFSLLASLPKVASLGEVIVLNDNFDSPIHLDVNKGYTYTGTNNKLVSTITTLVCLEGRIEITNNLKPYTLKANDAVVNNSGTIGELKSMSADTRFLLMVLNNNFYFPFITQGDTAELLRGLADYPVCHLNDNEVRQAVGIYNGMKQLLNQEEKPLYVYEIAKGMVQAFSFTIFSRLMSERSKNQESMKRHEGNRSHEIYTNFLREVERNYMKQRDIKFYADRLCLTPKYLSQIVYKESGSYAGEHIKSYVIVEAKALIKSHNYTMQQISDMLNFTSLSFFSKYFKAATGFSPMQYQNQ